MPVPDAPAQNPDLSIVIVNFKSSGVLKDCLKSIGRSRLGLSYEIIVVDNDSWDAGMDELRKDHPGVMFLPLQENRGFAGGNNTAFARARGSAILLLNPDTEVEANAIQTLYDRLWSGERVGMTGPRIFYANGALQTRYTPKKMPTLFNFFCEITYLDKLFSKNPIINAYYGADFKYDREQELGQLSGACLMVKKEVIGRVGGIDEKLFLYFDEADWCQRARKAGYRILYVPSASIVHHEGQSAGLNKPRSVELWHNSQLYLTRKHYGAAAALLLYLMNLIGFALRIAAAPFYLVKYRNADRVIKNLRQLGYHLDLRHLTAVFKS